MNDKNNFSGAALVLAFGLAIAAMIWATGHARSEDAVPLAPPTVTTCITEADALAEMAGTNTLYDLDADRSAQFRATFNKMAGEELMTEVDHILVFADNDKDDTLATTLFFKDHCLVGYGHPSVVAFKTILYSESL